MNEAICPDCGERNARGTEFCGGCGAFLAWDEPGATVAPPSTAPPVAPTGPPARPVAPPPVRPVAPPPVRPVAPTVPPLPVGRYPTVAPPLVPMPSPPGGSRRTWYQPPPPAPSPPTHGFAPAPDLLPPAAALAPPDPEPPATEYACPRCAVANEAGRRFCRKCGLALAGPRLHDAGPGGPPPPPERLPWWRRIFRPAPNTRRAARLAYRQSLPLRYRAVRWVLALLGVGALIGGLSLIGQNPVGWAVNRWNDLRGATVQVSGLQAHTEPEAATVDGSGQGGPAPTSSPPASSPPTAEPGPDAAPLLLDNLADTVWTVPWTASSAQDPVRASCRNPADPTGRGVPESVVVTLPDTVTLTHLSVAAGLPKDDSRRAQQYRPRTLQLAFTDGTCQRVDLADIDGLQPLSIDKVDTGAVRIWVVDAFGPASDQPQEAVAIAEVRLFQRP